MIAPQEKPVAPHGSERGPDPAYTIWKYNLEARDVQELQLPRLAKPLHTAYVDGRLQLWALVATSPAWPVDNWVIRTVATGGAVEGWWMEHHLSTLVLHGGSLVLHVFARKTTS